MRELTDYQWECVYRMGCGSYTMLLVLGIPIHNKPHKPCEGPQNMNSIIVLGLRVLGRQTSPQSM